MAISVIRTTSSSGTGTSLTFSILVDGTDTLLYATPGCGGNTSRDITAVTHNGDACSVQWTATDGAFVEAEGWYRIAPDAGTFDVVVTAAFGGGGTGMAAGATLLNGAHQSGGASTFGTPVTAGAGTTANTITVGSEVGAIVISGTATDDESGITAGDTQLWKVEGIQSDMSFGGMSQVGAASVTMNWTQDISGWASGGVSIKPSAGGGAAFLAPPNHPILQAVTRASYW